MPDDLDVTKIGGKEVYKDEAHADRAAGQTALQLDQFDASCECAEVTCLYNGTNWWLEELVESDRDLDGLVGGMGRGDAFL